MLFRQLFDQDTWTYTYLIADEKTKQAALIDSVAEQSERDAKLLKELGLDLKYLMETHVHADHITGVTKMKQHFPNAKSVVSKEGGAPCADILTHAGEKYTLGDIEIKVLSTPGHTNGCVSYMNNLKLPHPKKIAESVPANQHCGNLNELVTV